MKSNLFKPKLAAVLMAILLLSLSFAGCEKRADEPSGFVPPATLNEKERIDGQIQDTEPREYTDSEAAEHNATLPEVRLVQFEPPVSGQEIAVITTNKGVIKIMLFREKAPGIVDNFVRHTKSGYYNGLSFHRVISGSLIQSGDASGDGKGDESAQKDADGNSVELKNEFSMDLWHFRGALSMVSRNKETANGSQFFIVQASTLPDGTLEHMKEIQFPQTVIDKYEALGGKPALDWNYSVFGMVIEGMDVVDQIAALDTNPTNDEPLEPIIITTIEIELAP